MSSAVKKVAFRWYGLHVPGIACKVVSELASFR